MVVRGVDQVDVSVVQRYARDLRSLLEDSDYTERKAFLRSFVKRIVVDQEEVTVHYKLPLPPDGKSKDKIAVLPIDTFGGPFGTVLELLFEMKRLIPAVQHLLIAMQDPQRNCAVHSSIH